jgi:uncharacterized protein YbjT (DUF2867 family)
MQENKSGKSIVITGVTGSQGGAAARKLLNDGWRVRGLTRNPEGKEAKALRSIGVETVPGDMGDMSALESAFANAHGVYAVTDFFRNGVAKEIMHGKLIADIAKKSGVRHLVFSSVISADRKTGVPHFESKWAIEQYIEQLKIPATIIRPAVFMEDLTDKKYVPPANWGMIARLAGLDTRIKWIAIEDIATVVARVFSDPETFINKKLAIAGDEKSIRDAREVFKKVDGKAPFKFSMPSWLFRRLVNNDLVEMWLWFRHGVFDASVAETRKISPGLMDMEGWLRHKRAKVESRS